MSSIEWIATLLGIACVALGVVRSQWTFPAGIASVALVGIVVWRERLYSDAVLQAFFIGANVYGWVNWARSRARNGAVVVGRLMPIEARLCVIACVTAAIVWGAAMAHWTDAAWPWWDAGIAVVSVAAQWLMAQRRIENWTLWIAVDLAAIPLYAIKGLWLFAGLYVIYLGLSVWGLIDWRMTARRQAAA